jgi:hypothetical protein
MAALALLSGGGAALGQSGSRQSAATTFGQQRPGNSTGVSLAIDYVNPGDRQAKPPAVQKVVNRLQRGTVIDTSVPARCTASDAELTANGAAACPAASNVGSGEVDLDSGLAGPSRMLANDVTLLNNRDELIFLLESKGGGPRSRFVSRNAIAGATITSEVPPVPGGPPDGFLAIKRVRILVQRLSVGRGSRQRNYVTTPNFCPRSRNWTNTATFTYRDGVSQTVSNRSPCVGTRARGRRDYKAPRIRLRGVPRKRCTRRRFRARVRIAERWSGLRRARLSLDGRRLLVTRKKRLTRRIRAGRLRPGRHRLTVIARDNAGNRSVKKARFRTCRPGQG